MINNKKKRLVLSLCCALVASTFPVGAAACFGPGEDSSNSSTSAPLETFKGEYYATANDGADMYTLTFNAGQITLTKNEDTLKGTFTSSNEKFAITFEDGTTAKATMEDDVITFKHGNLELNFLEKVEYTVSFNVEGKVTKVTKYNGQTVEAPETPTKEGAKFVGWYLDQAYQRPYAFATPVTKDITLYARFVVVNEDAEVFTVKFVVDGAPYGEPVKTDGGILTELPIPTKAGATFAGWWMSDAEDANKLTAKYDAQVIQENKTLYAVWKSAAPEVSVTETGVTWTAEGQNNNYTVEITKPDGTKKSQNLGTTSYAFDFTKEVAGEYIVKVTLNGKTTTMYYQNKKLAKVCNFTADETSLLQFNAVENAEKYLLTIECGDATHQHVEVELTETCYDFSNCEMQKDGIKFTVKAVANGYTASTSETFVVVKNLEAAANVAFDEANHAVTWDKVENAQGYKVEVTANGKTDTYDVTAENYSLVNYTGAITVKVTPYAKGYNAPAAASASFTKQALAAPTNVKLEGQQIVWTAVEGATGYKVMVDGKAYDATTNAFDLSGIDFADAQTSTKIQVMALGATAAANSVYSVETTIAFGAMSDTLTYQNGSVYWDAVLNVQSYEVKVNNEQAVKVNATENSLALTFTTAGKQTIAVRCYNGAGVASEWVTMEVTTAKVTFEGDGATVEAMYKVEGDTVALPEVEKEGYTFMGWYDMPGASVGTKYENLTMGAEDTTVYARWNAKNYKVTLDAQGGDLEAREAEVTYDGAYNLGVPTTPDVTKIFVGWFTEQNGEGLRYTDHNGDSTADWRDDKDVTLYAGWKDAFIFTLDVDGESYSVKQVTGIDAYTNSLTIPTHYEGKPVTRIEADAFKGSSVVEINVPNTIKEINIGIQGPSGAGLAFPTATTFKAVNVYKVEGDHEVFYETIDGILYKVSSLDAEEASKELIYIPRGKSYYDEKPFAVPEGVTAIGIQAFKYAKYEKVTMPSTMKLIGAEAFYLSDVLEIDFAPTPEGQEPVPLTIEESAFKSSDLLVKITLPERLSNLELGLFTGCNALMEIYVEGTNGAYKSSEDGVLLNANGTEIVYFPLGRGGSYTIPEGISSIAAGAFKGCKQLTSLVIPGYVENIGKEAFSGCSNLTSLVFLGDKTDTYLTIAESAFYGCSGITELTLPANLAKLEAHAFGSVTKLTTITLNTTEVAELAEKAFATTSGVFYMEVVNLGADVDAFDIGGVFGQKVAVVNVDPANQNIKSEDGVLYDYAVTKILYYPHEKQGAYVTPATLTEIGANVFKAHKYLTSVTIGKNVTTIGNGAFDSCSELAEVKFEEGGTEALTIGDRAFYGADAKELILPARVTTIGNEAFMQYGLRDTETKIVLPEGLISIGDSAFRQCWDLKEIKIPSTVQSIGKDVFYVCNELSGLTVDENNQYYMAIGGVLYAKENGVATELLVCPRGVAGVVDIPKTVSKIADMAFYMNDRVTEVTFSEGVVGDLVIGEQVFYSSVSLKKIALPEGLTKISKNAFWACYGLEEVVIPSTLASIENNAFQSCKLLSKLTFAPTPAGQDPVPLVIEDATSGSYSAFYGCEALTEVNFPERTAKIGNYAFASYNNGQGTETKSGIEKVVIPASVTTIGNNAFYNAPLQEVIFAEGCQLENISNYAFYGTKITTLTIPEGVTSIGTSASSGLSFAYCKQLTTINLPSTLEALHYESFYQCSALTTVNFPNGCNLKVINDQAFRNCTSLTEFVIPASVESIGQYALADCTNLTSITFEENSNLKKIDKWAFQKTAITKFAFPETAEAIELTPQIFSGCKELKEVHLSSTVTNIDNVFANCPALVKITIAEDNKHFKNHETLPIITNLTSDAIRYIYGTLQGEFVIPEGYTQISARAFEGQGQVTKIVIPKSMIEIGEYAFSNCTGLQSVEFAEGSKLTTIGEYAFEKCGLLTTIAIPDGVTEIPNRLFSRCSMLSDVTLGNNVTVIGERAFEYNYALKKIDLPDSLTTLKSYAFTESGLEELTLPENYQAPKNASGVYQAGTYNSIFKNCYALKKVTLPDELALIVNSMFNGCTALEEINIPTGATQIGSSVFSGCTALKKVDFTGCKTLTLIGSSAFNNCAALTQVDLTDATALTKIDGSAFKGSGLTSIVIPESVTTFGTYVFSNCASLSSVTLPSEIKQLGNYMFESCTSLTEIELPDTLTYLGTYTFQKSGLTKVTIPAGVTQLGNSATACSISSAAKTFFECLDLTEVTFHENFKKVGMSVFEGCANLTTLKNTEAIEFLGNSAFKGAGITSLDLPGLISTGSTAVVGTYAFANCANLTTVNLPNLQRLSNYMFQNCSALTTVEIPMIGKNTTSASIGTYAFQNCSALTTIVLPDNLKYIPNYMFDGCTSLENVTWPSALINVGTYSFRNTAIKKAELSATVTTVGDYAFFGSAIESMHIPANLKTIGSTTYPNAFANCKNLKAFTVDTANKTFAAVDGALVKGTTLICYPAGADYVDTLNLPAGTVIGKYAFYGCENIRKVVLPEGTKSLPQHAFAYFLGEEVVLPASCTTLGAYGFLNASNLKTVNIPEGVTELTGQLFRDSGLESIVIPETVTKFSAAYVFTGTNLKTVVVPESVTSMSTYAFSDCVYLESVVLPQAITTIPAQTFQGCIALKNVTFSNNLVEVGSKAFLDCAALESITLPETVTKINTNAFQNCTSLKTMYLPASLTTLGNYAFQNCTSLKEMNMPASLTTLGNYVLENTGFETFTIPSTVTSMGTYMFRYAANLKSVIFEEGLTTLPNYTFVGCPVLEDVQIPESMTEIGTYVFSESGLTEFTVPKTVTKIGGYLFKDSKVKKVTFTNGYATYGGYMFQGCTELESVELPEGIVEIGSTMFKGCTSLKSVKLPSTLEKINSNAFEDCTALESINIPDSVWYIGLKAFMNCTSLKSIIIPEGVTGMYGNVFNGWTADQTIYLLGAEGDYKVNTTWMSAWIEGCEAKIVWEYNPEA